MSSPTSRRAYRILPRDERSLGGYFSAEHPVHAHSALEGQLALIYGSRSKKRIDLFSAHVTLLMYHWSILSLKVSVGLNPMF